MELTYSSRKLLKELRKLVSSESDVLAFVDGSATVRNLTTEDQADLSHFPGFFGVIDYLIRQGALKYPYEDNHWYVSFTHEGLHPHQVYWEVIKINFFKSVFVPAVVSFITSLLTLLGTGLGQWLLRWIQAH